MSPAYRTARERREAATARRERRGEVTDPDVVMAAATAFLSVRPRSVEETRRRLARLGYPGPLIEDTVARLETLGYLDDLAFGRSWVESRDRSRPRGEAVLRRELQQKGLSRPSIDEVLAERQGGTPPWGPGDVERAAAHRLLERRARALLHEPDGRRRRQKAYALLARGGFDPDICREVAEAAVAPGAGPDV